MRAAGSTPLCLPALVATCHLPAHPLPFARRSETYIKQEPGESPNDRNDRAIRVAAQWYTKRLPGHKVC